MNSASEIPGLAKGPRSSVPLLGASQDTIRASWHLTTLIGRCAQGNQRAFLALYDATSAKLYGIVLSIVKREHWAEEVLQDVYMKIWQAAGNYHASRGKPMTWLINIARNRAIDLLRGAEHAATQRSEELDDGLPSELDPLRATETGAEMDWLAECLKQLKTGQGECILLVYHEGYTVTEVARRTGYPVGTVKTWIRRGLTQLRRAVRHPDQQCESPTQHFG